MLNKWKFFEKLKLWQKILLLLIVIPIITILIYYAFIYWLGSILRLFSDNPERYTSFEYGLHNAKNFASFLTIICVIIIIVSIIYSSYRSYKNRVTSEDDRGIKYMRDGTEGTRHPADKEEVKRKFNVGNIKNTNDIVFGQYGESLEEVVSYKEKEKGATGTKHILACAKSGSGKTFAIVIINVILCALRRHSQVVVDVKGEIYRKVGQFLRSLGIDVKLLNLKNLEYTEFYNVMQEVISQKTGRLDSTRLRIFGNIFMKNSEGEKKRDVWYNGAQNLIEATIGLVAYRRERKILDGYVELYETITGEVGSSFAKMLDEQEVKFSYCENKIKEVANTLGYPKEEIESILEEIKENAPKFNLSAVYDAINKVDELDEEFNTIPNYHPARAAANRYIKIAVKELKNGIVSGAQQRFKIFDDKKLRDALSYDGINFKTINKKPSAYFVAVPDTDESINVIASLFFSFFYLDVMDIYDEEEDIAKMEEGRENPCIPVMAMLEEFGSLGVVSGDEKQFGTIMSNSRSRLIYSILIIQTISQLEANYGSDVADAIISSCEYKLCLGANDEKTKRFFAYMSGLATVLKTSYKQEEGFFTKDIDKEITINTTKRYVYTEDEIEMLSEDHVMVFKFATNPFILNPVPWIYHPVVKAGKCPEVPYFKNIKPIDEVVAEMSITKRKDVETDLHNRIKALVDLNLKDKIKLERQKEEEMRSYYSKFDKGRLIDVIMLMVKDKLKASITKPMNINHQQTTLLEEDGQDEIVKKPKKKKKKETSQKELENVINTFLDN